MKLSYSGFDIYRTCPLKYKYRYIDNLRNVGYSESQVIGTTIHQAINKLRSGTVSDALTVVNTAQLPETSIAKLTAVMECYSLLYEGWDIGTSSHQPEKSFSFNAKYLLNFVNKDSKFHNYSALLEKSQIVGSIDEVAKTNSGKDFYTERKTTSLDIELDSPYVRKIKIDSQIAFYWIACSSLGMHPEFFLYDITKIPSYRRKRTESADKYSARVKEKILANPKKFFRMLKHSITPSELSKSASDIIQTVLELDNPIYYRRNTSSCIRSYDYTCEFLQMCIGKE